MRTWSHVHEIRGYVKWTDEVMDKMEKQLGKMVAQMHGMKPKVARIVAEVTGVVSSSHQARFESFDVEFVYLRFYGICCSRLFR